MLGIEDRIKSEELTKAKKGKIHKNNEQPKEDESKYSASTAQWRVDQIQRQFP